MATTRQHPLTGEEIRAIRQRLNLTRGPLMGAEIRSIRQRLNLTQQQMAQLVGLTCETMRAWELDRAPTRRYRADLIRTFGQVTTPRRVGMQVREMLKENLVPAALCFLLQEGLKGAESRRR